MDKFFDFLASHEVFQWVLLVCFLLVILSILIVLIVALIQGREVSFWPPRIGPLVPSLLVPDALPEQEQSILINDSNPSMYDPTNYLSSLSDLLESLIKKRAGIEFKISDPNKNTVWVKNSLNMLRQIFLSRVNDIQVTWLRPTQENPNQLALFLYAGDVDPSEHHLFSLGEGLVGKVWQQGESASTSGDLPHRWWVYRAGCENTTYLCASVGEPASGCGVLAVGSDNGFHVFDSDLRLVELFAVIIGLSCTELIGSKRDVQ